MDHYFLNEGLDFPIVYHFGDGSKDYQRQGDVMGCFAFFKSTVARIEECGVDLNKVVCDLKPDAIKDTDLCLSFAQSLETSLKTETRHNHRRFRASDDDDDADYKHYFPGNEILMFGNKKTGDKKTAILLIKCSCNLCLPRKDARRERVLSSLFWSISSLIRDRNWDPTKVTLKVEMGAAAKTFTDLEFQPAYAFDYELEDPKYSDITMSGRNVVFWAQVNLKDLEFLLDLDDTVKKPGEPGLQKEEVTRINAPRTKRPTISILNIEKVKPNLVRLGIKLPSGADDSKEENMPSDFVIVSPDGKEHRCHQAVLKARSPYFESLFSFESQTDEDVKPARTELPQAIMTEDGVKFTGKTVEALLEFIYDEENTEYRWELEVAAGLMKLAHYYQINDLFPKAAKDVVNGLKQLRQKSDPIVGRPAMLLDLYAFVQLLDGIELMYRVNTEIATTLKWFAAATDKPDGDGDQLDVLQVMMNTL